MKILVGIGVALMLIIGVVLSLLLATRMSGSDAVKMAVVVGLGLIHWLVIRSRVRAGSSSP